MKEFDYELDYKTLDFTKSNNRGKYRIGRGEQGVLIVRPYTDIICQHWRFRDVETAQKSSQKIYSMFLEYLEQDDFIGADMCRKFLEMGFTRARRYANHHSGQKYDSRGKVKPQEEDWDTCEYAESARIFKKVRDLATYNDTYQKMRKQWRASE